MHTIQSIVARKKPKFVDGRWTGADSGQPDGRGRVGCRRRGHSRAGPPWV